MFGLAASRGVKPAVGAPLPAEAESEGKTFMVRGVVREVGADGKTVVLSHESIPGYMEAMTMPFKVKQAKELAGVRVGDTVSFHLRVTDTESWVEDIVKVGFLAQKVSGGPASREKPITRTVKPRHPLLDYRFTNELGEAVSLADFHGQALALTFFYTRCPIPEFCPRLSRNFEAASRKLAAMPDSPTNWHFLSVTFDPAFDTPPVLKAYGERYDYDPNHWSFLTGPADKVAELAAGCDAKFDADSGFFNHNFRTLIIDATGHLQMVFPIGGDLSDALVEEIRKAAAIKNTAQLSAQDN